MTKLSPQVAFKHRVHQFLADDHKIGPKEFTKLQKEFSTLSPLEKAGALKDLRATGQTDVANRLLLSDPTAASTVPSDAFVQRSPNDRFKQFQSAVRMS